MENKNIQLIILIAIAIIVSLATHFLVLNFSGIENKRTLVIVPVLVAVYIVKRPKVSLMQQILAVSAAAIVAELVNLFMPAIF